MFSWKTYLFESAWILNDYGYGNILRVQKAGL